MSTPKKIPEKFQAWIDARKRYHLSHAEIQMARELGMNPMRFAKIANHKQEPWKAPLPEFIKRIYFKRFGKDRPDDVRSIEEVVQRQEKKKAEKKARRELTRQGLERDGGVKGLNAPSPGDQGATKLGDL